MAGLGVLRELRDEPAQRRLARCGGAERLRRALPGRAASWEPDNDILLYWPIHDFWSNADGTTRNLTVHARDWFEEQPIGKVAKELWEKGYTFDYVSAAHS